MTVVQKPQVKSPGSSKPEVVTPGVTFSFNMVLDKAGSSAVAQFHLPLSMSLEEMSGYTRKAINVLELEQLRLDRNKLKAEIKLSAHMLERLKREVIAKQKKAEAARNRAGNGKLGDPKIAQELLAVEQDYRNNEQRHEHMQADLLEMEHKLGVNSGTDSKSS